MCKIISNKNILKFKTLPDVSLVKKINFDQKKSTKSRFFNFIGISFPNVRKNMSDPFFAFKNFEIFSANICAFSWTIWCFSNVRLWSSPIKLISKSVVSSVGEIWPKLVNAPMEALQIWGEATRLWRISTSFTILVKADKTFPTVRGGIEPQFSIKNEFFMKLEICMKFETLTKFETYEFLKLMNFFLWNLKILWNSTEVDDKNIQKSLVCSYCTNKFFNEPKKSGWNLKWNENEI